MADLYQQGLTTPYNYNGVIVTPIYGIAINFFANRTPLFSRLDIAPLGALTFKTTSDNFRPLSTTLNNGGTMNSGDTTVVVTDSSEFMVGDVVEIQSETILITAVTVSTETLTVSRGYAGTSAASHVDASVMYLVGNTRTGAENEV